ncbi:MAG: DUF1295 domain-containing protein [Gammaproteobacteria bacterium]|nr:DUF1295 domain-containing protein [Gammaproteobacteria bacterium]
MNRTTAWLGIAGAIVVGALVAFAGSDGGIRCGALPVFAVCIALAYAMQWLAFVPAWLSRSERFFDLTGSATYLAGMGVALLASGAVDLRSGLIAAFVAVWAVRLGLFLFLRIRRAGADRRFDRLKARLPAFLMTWTLQGAWVSLACAPALAAITSRASVPGLDGWLLAGAALWLAGFAIEVLADEQKRHFRIRPENAERFIDTGLWGWCRHPNYFGEILLWCGVAMVAAPALQGWQLATLLSPLLIGLQLTFVSGVPLLDTRAKKRWGEDAAYRRYRERTPMLLPLPPRR